MELPDSIFKSGTKIFLVGAMGSGKTEIAINYSRLWSVRSDMTVGLLDLDMVKPSFRLRNTSVDFKNSKVKIILPEEKHGYADFPIISAEMESYITDPKRPAVVDVGGDPAGARLLGRYRGRMDPSSVQIWSVYNGRRPFSRGDSDIRETMDGIEKACGMKITGLIHNTNLMYETTMEVFSSCIEEAVRIAGERSIPVQFHCIREDLFCEATKKFSGIPILPLKLYVKPAWVRDLA